MPGPWALRFSVAGNFAGHARYFVVARVVGRTLVTGLTPVRMSIHEDALVLVRHKDAQVASQRMVHFSCTTLASLLVTHSRSLDLLIPLF